MAARHGRAIRQTLDEIFANYNQSEENLTRLCSDEHRDELAKKIKDWKSVGPALRFNQRELNMIDNGYENDDQKKTTLLIQWSMRKGKGATYLNLAKLLFDGGLLDPLTELCCILARATPRSTGQRPQ